MLEGGLDALGPLGESIKDLPLTAEQVAYISSGDAVQRLRMESSDEATEVLEIRYEEMIAHNVAQLRELGVRTVADVERLLRGELATKAD